MQVICSLWSIFGHQPEGESTATNAHASSFTSLEYIVTPVYSVLLASWLHFILQLSMFVTYKTNDQGSAFGNIPESAADRLMQPYSNASCRLLNFISTHFYAHFPKQHMNG
jgi:hypothetical protein